MKIQILQIAKTKSSLVQGLELDYEKRLQPYVQLESITLSASKSDDRARAQQEELEAFTPKLNPQATLVTLDETGRQLTSEAFADWLREQRDFGSAQVQFLIGGSNGLHPTLLQQADLVLSLSKMTFTHEMVRPFLKEQLYRAMMILTGKRYHK